MFKKDPLQILLFVVVDVCQDLFNGVTSPNSSCTCGGCGQLSFINGCEPDHREPSGHDDMSHLLFEPKLATGGPKNRPILRVFVCPTCVPLWKLTTSRHKKV